MPNLNPDYLVTIVQSDTNTIVQAPMPEEFMFDSASNYEAPFTQGLFATSGLASLLRVAGVKLSNQALTAQLWQGSNDTVLSLDLDFQAESNPILEVRDPILKLLKMTTPYLTKDLVMRSPGPQLDLSVANAIQIGKDAIATGISGLSAIGNAIIGRDDKTTDTKLGNAGNSVPTGGGSVATTPQQNSNLGQGDAWKTKVSNAISIKIGRYAFFDSVVITNVQKTYSSNIDPVTGQPMHAKVMVQFKPLFQLLQSDLDKIFQVNTNQR